MSFESQIQNVVRLATVDRAGVAPQVRYYSGRAQSDTPYMEPQGMHFIPPASCQGLLLSPNADPSLSALVVAQGSVPSDGIAAGEGGLHYLGSFRVFLAADGTLHLGEKDPDDYVALASKVLAELNSVKTDLTNLKTMLVAHTHAGVTTGAGTSGTSPAFAGYTPHTPASVASTSVKCK